MAGPDKRTFDGVICFAGGDWWYHNRGHYDMQMMRELSQHVPVLFVNSVGIRVPKPAEGAMFFHRVTRKLRSLARGHVRVHDRFSVLSPFVVPGRLGTEWSVPIASRQIRLAAWRSGIRRPLVWITCPPGAEFLPHLKPVGLVYQRTDRWEAFPDTDPAYILELHRRLREQADLTLFCASLLYDEEAEDCRGAAYVDHGVDFDVFAAAGARLEQEPGDLDGIGRPRAGFVGGIDASTFDPELFVAVARQLPDVEFVCVGACSLEEGWADLPNVHLLGQKPYSEVAAYMAACDVLLMPWNQSEWIRACNPVKLKEYLAVGRPIVTTPFEELKRYEGYVRIARGADDFARQVRAALADPPSAGDLRARVQNETWAAKAIAVLDALAQRGLQIAGDGARKP
jgi:glycosyltransferase involved in cell wall biosynthesis